MLPPPISNPFKTISYWLVKISFIFFLASRFFKNSGLGAEKGLRVKVHLLFSSFSKNGKSITQQKASRSLLFLSFLKSGLSVLYFSIAFLYDNTGKGIS